MTETSEIIDVNALKSLQELMGGGVDELNELITDFLHIGPELLAKMQKSLDQADATGLKIASHTLKSNAGDFGATALSAVCGTIEKLATNDSLLGAQDLVNQANAHAIPSFAFLADYQSPAKS